MLAAAALRENSRTSRPCLNASEPDAVELALERPVGGRESLLRERRRHWARVQSGNSDRVVMGRLEKDQTQDASVNVARASGAHGPQMLEQRDVVGRPSGRNPEQAERHGACFVLIDRHIADVDQAVGVLGDHELETERLALADLHQPNAAALGSPVDHRRPRLSRGIHAC